MTLAATVIERMAARGLTLATAEASVGGLIGHLLAQVPGASRVFLGGVAPYSNASKVALLAVPAALFVERGAVSADAALAMAHGAREAFHADVALAETGIASPTGNPGRPLGMYHIALAAPDREGAREHRFEGDRAAIQRHAADAALAMLLDYLDETR